MYTAGGEAAIATIFVFRRHSVHFGGRASDAVELPSKFSAIIVGKEATIVSKLALGAAVSLSQGR